MKRPLTMRSDHAPVLSPDGHHVAAVVRDVALLDVESRKKVWTVRPFSYPAHLAFDPTGKKLAVKSNTGQIAVLDAATGDVLIDFGNKEDGEGSNVCFSECGEFLIDGSSKGVLSVRKIADGSVAVQHSFEAQRIDTVALRDEYVFVHHAHKMRGDKSPHTSFSRWKWPLDKRKFDEFPFQPNQATGMNPISSGAFLVAYGHPRSADDPRQPVIRVARVDAEAARDICETSEHGTIRGLQVAPNQSFALCAVEEHILAVNLQTGALHKIMDVHSPWSFSFSADGSRMAIGAGKDSVVVTVEDMLPAELR